ELSLPLRLRQAVGDAHIANRKGHAGDPRGQRIPGTTLRTMRNDLVALACFVLGAGCNSSPAPVRAVAADTAFCAQIQTHDARLSRELAPLAPRMRTSTGIYPLEEGDVSMIARAWLTEAAEHSIDVQYFIFSADNVGLIAVDYLLRAAD